MKTVHALDRTFTVISPFRVRGIPLRGTYIAMICVMELPKEEGDVTSGSSDLQLGHEVEML
jgi:hypothetical protein